MFVVKRPNRRHRQSIKSLTDENDVSSLAWRLFLLALTWRADGCLVHIIGYSIMPIILGIALLNIVRLLRLDDFWLICAA